MHSPQKKNGHRYPTIGRISHSTSLRLKKYLKLLREKAETLTETVAKKSNESPWLSPLKRKRFFEKFARDQSFDSLSPEAWYAQPRKKILETKGAKAVVSYHNHKVSQALMDLFPDIGLEIRKFKRKKTISKRDKRGRLFFEKYARKNRFDYLSPRAWYSQPYFKIKREKGAKGVLKYYKSSVSNALIDLFPEIGLEKSCFRSRGGKYKPATTVPIIDTAQTDPIPDISNQSHLEQVVKQLFPQEDIAYNSRESSQVTNPITGSYLEIDVWIRKLKLGFEFQDIYHYVNTWYSQRALDAVKRLDESKRNTVKLSGTTLIHVPFWWNDDPESLVSTIQFERPDLLTDHAVVAHSIQLNPPSSLLNMDEVPGVGGLMLASFPINHTFSHSISSKNWWIGEKYDGMRGCWNPTQREAYSRSGKKLPLPRIVSDNLPNIYLDGEFWFGRGLFPLIYSLIDGNSSWHEIRMISFDDPNSFIHHLPFEKRYNLLLTSIPPHHPLTIIAQRILCENTFHLHSLLGKIISYGGEGIILRRVGSLYEPGRSKHLIKLKTSYGDTEGLVAAVNPNAVTLKLPNGQLFPIPTHNVHVLSPPLQIGEIVTFSYEKLANRRIPVNAEIIRRRSELKWEEVVASGSSSAPLQHVQEGLQAENFTKNSRGFWTFANMREYVANFAKNLNLDPLVSSTWHKIPPKLIFETKGGKAILKKYKDPWTALTSLFPDIGLNDKNFQNKNKKWYTKKDRRSFFENFAKENGFDYLSPSAWYSLPTTKFTKSVIFQGATRALLYHKGSISKALIELFPEIGLEESKFKT